MEIILNLRVYLIMFNFLSLTPYFKIKSAKINYLFFTYHLTELNF